MGGLSLAARITLLIVVVLIIGFGASTILTIQRESTLLLELNKRSVRRLTDTLVASIEGAMLQERPDVTRGLIQELKNLRAARAQGGTGGLESLTIYRRNGVEAFTDLSTLEEVQKNAELSKEVLANIARMQERPGATMSGPLFARALETLQTQESLVQENGVPLFVVARPIPNQERCQGCHGTDHKARAVVRVATSMAPVFAEVRQQRNNQIVIGILTIVAAAGVLAVAMGRVVVRPIRGLATVARRIGDGDFRARAPVRSRDEIGQLGSAFNDMTAKLAHAYTELEAKNTELATALQN